MSRKEPISDEHKAIADHWLLTAARFHATLHGAHLRCTRRTCKSAAQCMAAHMHENPSRSPCGRALQEGEVRTVIQLTLFGLIHGKR